MNPTCRADCRYLGKADTNHCRQQRSLVAALHKLEASVARALGVSLLHAVPELMLQAAYREFLQRTAAAGGLQI